MELTEKELFERWESVQNRIEAACQKAGRRRSDVELMVVSKTQPVWKMQALRSLGQTLFGENRVPEALEKKEKLGTSVEIHMIGHLQTNKAKDAVELDAVQSLDSRKLAIELNKRLESIGKTLPVLVEIHTSVEESKHGLRTESEVFELVEAARNLPRLSIRGLMTMAPFTHETGLISHSFRQLKAYQSKLKSEFPDQNWETLSMGMSNDFELAIEEGSTLVRIGTALLGASS